MGNAREENEGYAGNTGGENEEARGECRRERDHKALE